MFKCELIVGLYTMFKGNLITALYTGLKVT
jgi:hypothetical protein